jgi:hypothetical protein
VAGFCEHGNKTSVSIKGGDAAPWSQSVGKLIDSI